MNRSYANELKQAEKERWQTEEHLIGPQRLMLVGYWEWNLKTKKYGWCDEMYKIFNLTPQQSRLRTGTFFNWVNAIEKSASPQARLLRR